MQLALPLKLMTMQFNNAIEIIFQWYAMHQSINALPNLLCVRSLQHCSMILIFCLVFSCYVVGLSEDRSYGKLAPVGGFMFMAGWLAFAFWMHRSWMSGFLEKIIIVLLFFVSFSPYSWERIMSVHTSFRARWMPLCPPHNPTALNDNIDNTI